MTTSGGMRDLVAELDSARALPAEFRPAFLAAARESVAWPKVGHRPTSSASMPPVVAGIVISPATASAPKWTSHAGRTARTVVVPRQLAGGQT